MAYLIQFVHNFFAFFKISLYASPYSAARTPTSVHISSMFAQEGASLLYVSIKA